MRKARNINAIFMLLPCLNPGIIFTKLQKFWMPGSGILLRGQTAQDNSKAPDHPKIYLAWEE
jgi:hypothetical protein